jgi:uncharacterized protein YbaR (Trm112 family)/SAM-dependent methyltransferase
MEPDLTPLLACPACEGELQRAAAAWICPDCQRRHPVLDGLPWLFTEPDEALAEWRARLRLLLAHLRREAGRHERDLGREHLGGLTRRRLSLLARAYGDHAARLEALLAALATDGRTEPLEVLLALGTQLPATQGLSTYYTNAHRDWAWGEAENAAAVDMVAGVLQPGGAAGRLLVLGAGAGRLAYDLHQAGLGETTVGLDFNPLLVTIARRVCGGECVPLYEFPIAPKSLEDHATLRELRAPGPARPGLSFVLGDGLAAPFRPAAFDVLLTPWFVDVVPCDLTELMPRLNRLLAPGGRWIFFGSLAWADRPPASCYSLEELLALAPAAGFEPGPVLERPIPYMQSPASRHARLESTIAFAAVKRREVPQPPRARLLPEWLERTDVPVPALPEFREQSLSTRVYAFIMAMIDGRRSIEDMAALMQEQRLMTKADAVPAVRQFLARMQDDAKRRANF